jgi:two-component system, chemotaxis family, sensor kinase CheA
VTFSSDDRSAELRDLFFESAEEILQGMNEAGLLLEKSPGDPEQLRHVRRAVHTLKGDSAACGFGELRDLAHELEDVLTPEVAGKNAGLIAEVVLIAADTFHEMLAAYRGGMRPPVGNALRGHILHLLAEPVAIRPEGTQQPQFAWSEYERLMIAEACRRNEAVYNVALHVAPETPLRSAAFQLARKALQGAGKILALRPEEDASNAENILLIEAALSSQKSAEWIRKHCSVPAVIAKAQIDRIAPQQTASRDLLDILLESEAAAVKAGATEAGAPDVNDAEEHHESGSHGGVGHAAPENTLRVDATRIDSVMNLVGEMIIGKSMLQRVIAEFERRNPKDPFRTRFADALAFQSRVLGELQKSVMKIRMVPVEQLFRRFPRVVRDVAKLRNKDVDLEISGQNTDLDKGILDALAEPLAHLVRNAADHGIERAAEREAAGKAARGTIRLNAYHDGDHVVIEVSDDGKGLDREKIVRRAVEGGILTAEDASRLDEMEALQLVFAPGLSTADEITEISGRGVGLDVVKSTVEKLKGSVTIESVAGKSTAFRLSVPLTLASIQTLLFRAHGRLYAVPLASVAEITRITEDDIHRVDDHEVFQLRGQVQMLIRLDRLGPRIVGERPKRVFVIVIQLGGKRFGLAVDSLVGEEELVIKALEDRLVTSPLVSGASILGDGTVVLILNVPALISHLSKTLPLRATA